MVDGVRLCLFAAGLAVLASASFAFPTVAMSGEAEAILRHHAEAGTLAKGHKALAARVAANASDVESIAALGFMQFGRSVEKLGQALHRHGLQAPSTGGFMLPVLRLPVPHNPNPEPISYQQMRTIYATLLADLAQVDRTLAELPAGAFKLKLNLAAIALDLDGDGKKEPQEALGAVIQALMGPASRRQRGQLIQPPPAQDALPQWNVAFDRADAVWLRGYARLLSAFCEFVLAHDWHDAFTATAYIFFPKVEGGQNVAGHTRPNPLTGGMQGTTIADFIAFLHMQRFNVLEPDRMRRVRRHLLEVVKLSRENWKEILAETDDDDEWIPSPKQKNATINVARVTDEIVANWRVTLDEFEAVLEGRKLIGHWRFEKGIDLKQFFEAPRQFDLMLWITGPAAVPYLKDGVVLSRRSVAQWQRMFGGNFLGFALWFN